MRSLNTNTQFASILPAVLVATALLTLSPVLVSPALAQNSTTAIKPAAAAPTSNPITADATAEDIAFANRLSTAFKSVASKIEPSVIHITALQKIQPVTYDIFGRPIARGAPRLQPTGLGSGVIASPDGYAITNNHVIANADTIKVKLSTGDELDAKLIGRDELTDLAVLKILPPENSAKAFPHANFSDSDSLEVGEWVVAIGSPFGLSNTVTAGIISAKGRSVTPRETGRTQEDFIQTDAAINPGNSGGPLLNLQGQIVGINSAIASRGGSYEGIGFAIPGNTARAVMENIIANGRMVRGYLGAALAEAKREDLGTFIGPGVVIRDVMAEGPAEQSGLRVGDIITKFKGSAVNESRLRTAIAVSQPGTKVDIEVLRGSEVKSITVSLGDQSMRDGTIFIRNLGVTIRTLTPGLSRRMGYSGVTGVVVTEVDPNSRATNANPSPLQAGDVIVGIGTDETNTAEDFAKLAERLDYNRGATFNVVRDFKRGSLTVRD